MNDLTQPVWKSQQVNQQNKYSLTFASFSAISICFAVAVLFMFCSYYFEAAAFKALFATNNTHFNILSYSFGIAAFIAVIFNAGKVCLAFAHVYNERQNQSIKGLVLVRSLMICVSMFATMMVMSLLLNDPNAQVPYEREVKTTKRLYSDLRVTLGQNYTAAKDERLVARNTAKNEITQLHQLDIESARASYENEKNILKSNGDFYGERAKRFDNTVNQIKSKISAEHQAEDSRYLADLDRYKEQYQSDRSELLLKELAALSEIKIEDYLGLHESENKMIAATAGLISKFPLVGGAVETHHLTILLALMFTLVIEFVPLILFLMVFRSILGISGIKSEEALNLA